MSVLNISISAVRNIAKNYMYSCGIKISGTIVNVMI
jgi:hypothetical protein